MISRNNVRERFFGIDFDAVDQSQAVERIFDWVQGGEKICRFVVTPNVDRAVLHEHHVALQRAYADASLVLADGAPVVAASRLLGRPLPGRVTGSDLAPALFDGAAGRGGLRVFLLGAAPGVAEQAAANIECRWPAVRVTGTYCPPLGFEKDAAENEFILAKIAEARPDVLIIGFGAPKEELWIVAHQARIQAGVTLCIGATIDFLAGQKQRAPRWMRRAGIEWMHRVATEPRRLAGRYARDAWVFPRLVWRQWVADMRRTAADRAASG